MAKQDIDGLPNGKLQARNNCQHLLIFGDFNHHLIHLAYEDHAVHGLTDYMHYPAHILVRSLDPVVTELRTLSPTYRLAK